jgi:hypothetical protein
MSISSISSNYSIYQAYQTSGQNKFAQIRQDFQDLTIALKSSDLTGAQKAITDLQQLMPNSSDSNQPPNAFDADLNAVGQALQSGNLSNAQGAFAKLQQDVQSVQGHHHHHHHQNGASASAQSTPGIQKDNGQGVSSQNPLATDLNAVSKALQEGDLSDAQAAFAKLQQDMLSVQGHHHYHHHNASASDAQNTTTNNASAGINLAA